MKLTNHVRVREIEKETEKAPNVLLSNISGNTPFSKEVQHVVDDQFIKQLKAHGLQDQFLI